MKRLSGASCVVLFCAAVLAVAAERAHAGTIVSSPVTDLSVFPGGRVATKQRTLVVDGAPAVRAYLIWQLPATLVDVEHAALFLYTPTGGRGLRVHAMRASAGVASRLAADRASKLAATLRRTRARSWLNVDVTRFVRSGGSVSFFLAKAGADEMLVTSREGGAAFRPRLVVVTGRGPECTEASVAGSEDTVVAGRLSCVGKRAVTYRATTAPAHGAVTVAANGGFAYTPSENFHGVDGFGFQACEADPPGRSPPRCDAGRVAIRIAPVNDAPTAEAVSLRTAEDTPAGVALRASDVEGDPLSFALASQPSHGSAAVDGGTATYAPAENYSGPDSFVYLVSDGNGGTAAAVVSVDVAAVNDRPAALPASATTAEDTPAAVVLAGQDVEGDPLTFEIVAGPTHGSLSGSGAERTYTPAANYHGEDSFTFKVGDGAAESEVATVSLTVTPVNDAPVAADISVRLAEDGSAEVGLSGADLDGDPLTFEIVAGPTHGALSGTGATRVYTPAANYHGPDSFTYRVSDGALTSAAATVALTVERANDAPVCTDVTLATDEEVAGERDPACSDRDGDQLTYSVVAGGTKGTASVQGGRLRYVPHANANGLDSFTYRASDGSSDSAVATVSVDIRPVNDPPAAHDGALTTSEDTAKALVLGASDVDGDPLSFEIVAGPGHGALSGTGAERTYTPDANYHGDDSFTFRVGDGAAQSDVARVSVTVEAVNDAPTAGSVTATTLEDVAKEIALAGADVDGPALSHEIVAAPAHGTLSGDGATRTYTPAPNYHGPDAFTYRATDGTLFSSVATVTLTVAPVNDAPVAAGLSLTVREDGAKDLTLPAADADGDPLSYEIAAGPGHGILTGEGATRTYTPASNYHGPDSFTFRARDGSLDSNVATVSITIEAVNDAPGCPAAELTVTEDGSGEITPACTDVDGDALTLEVVGQGLKGLASVQGSSIRFAASPNANGDDSFTYRAVDGTATSPVATVSVRITPVNDAPTCADVELSTDEDVAAERDPSCADVDGDALTYSIAEQAAKGAASVAAGRLRYVPNANANGADSFTYKASDATASSAGARAAVTIAAVNDAPTATGQTVTLAEDAEKALTLQASDVDGDPLSFTIVTAPAHGTLSGTGADRTYAPAPNYHGSDSFTFRVRDGSLDSNVATVSLDVTPVNDVPVAQPDAYATPSRTVLNVAAPGVLENDNDVDGGSLTALLVSNPTHGTVDVRPNGSFSYDPRAGYHGHDWFTYSASDGTSRSNVVRVTIDVGGTNQTPVASDLSASTAEDRAKALTLPATDADGDELTYVIVSGPAHGTLSGSGAERTYTPAPNYHGPDSFTFRAKDPWAESNLATVSLTVDPVNDAPSSASITMTTPEDTPKTLTLAGSDVDGDTLTYEIVAAPSHGVVTGSGAERTYTPAQHYHGPDSFTYKVSDGTLESPVATISVTVEAVNDPPGARDLVATTQEDTAKTLTLEATDGDGDELTYEIVSGPAHGTLSGSGTERTYMPAPNYHGRDSFTYKVSDGRADSNVATVSLTVEAVNDAPVARDMAVAVTEDTAAQLALAVEDVDGDPLVFTIVSTPQHGSLSGSGAERTYTPAANFHGSDSFAYKVSDGSVESNVATVALRVEAVNDVPLAEDLHVTTSEDVAKALGLPATDVETAALGFTIVDGPAHGTLSGSGADRTYTPAANFHGADSFTFRADDGSAQSRLATVTVTVHAVNDPPTAAAQQVTTAEDTPKALTLAASDVDGDPLSYEILTAPSHGLLSGSGGERTYTPAPNFHGSDSFSYKVTDGGGGEATATVTVTVESVNDPPTAADHAAATAEDTAKALTLGATDADGDPLSFTVVHAPAHGTLSGSGAERTYTPDPDYNGPDELRYTAGDGSAQSAIATVSLSVTQVNDPPSAGNDAGETEEEKALVIPTATLLANDGAGPSNESNQSLAVTGVGSPVGGTVELAGGDVTFTPARNFNGAASFSYTVADDGLTGTSADPKTATGTMTVNVTPVNDRPVAELVSKTTNEDESVTFALAASDADGDALAFTIVSSPAHGSVTAPSGNEVTYTPAGNFHGPDSFSFIAGDGASESDPAVASLTVTSVNDAPALDTSGSPQLTPVNANANDPAGDTVAEILTSGAGGDQIITDVDGDPKGIAVTSVDGSGGTWEYRPVGGAWTAVGGVDAAAARLLDVDSRLRFRPAPGFIGSATMRFRAWDRSSGSVGATADTTVNGAASAFSVDVEEATITVIPNSLPVAIDDSAETTEDTEVAIDVLANDSDPDGTPLTIAEVTGPQDGTATVVEGVVRYRPHPNVNGTDRFSYTVRDAAGAVATAKVDIRITAENDTPIARGDAERVAEDGIVVFDPTGNDVAGPRDESGGAVTLRAITSPPQHGVAVTSASGPDAGKIRYTPTPGFTGTDVVTYEVCDDATPALCGAAQVDLTVSRVAATVETDPVPHRSSASTDAADDIAIWVDPNEPSRSVVIGTNKFTDSSTSGGLLVYDLNGTQLAYTNDGRMNNVDLRSGFTLGGEQVTLVAASQRTDGTANPPRQRRIALYRFDGATRTLAAVHGFLPTYEPLGACMYRSAKTGDFFVFVAAANGWVEQYQLSATPGGAAPMAATKVREFRVSTPPTGSTQDVVEGCVADDDLGRLYVSEEDTAIWRYSAEPDGGDARTQVDAVGGGQLTADIEGLAIANGPGDTGYLIASSQGSNSYAVYRRDGSNAFVRSFKIKDGAVDGTTFTDGIEVTSADLGPAFPNGMFVAQDNGNLPANQNFKLVPLEQIVPTAGLGSNGSCARPYTDASPWNTPIAAGAPVHPQSADHVAAITGPLTSDPTQFTFPVYEVDATTPRQAVTLTGWFSNVTNGGRTLVNQRAGTVELPIPPGAVPPGGDDDQIIMVDPWTGDEWGFSRATPNETTGGWTGWNAYHYSTRWSAVPPYDASGRPFFARGAGVPYLAGLVRPCELARGRIDHALAFAYDFPTSEFVYPASKSDGTSAGFPHMPQGSRLQLDPALTAGELGAMGCTGHCLTIARALQVYGMYIIDSSRRPKVMLEFEGTAGWGGAVTAATVSPIPVSAFRLLQS